MAVANREDFIINIRRQTGVERERHQKRTRAAVLYALQSVVFTTRVDTGRARGNWQASEGRPESGYDPTRYDFAGTEGNRDSFSEETAVVLAMSGTDIIWLHNGVPYIQILEGMDHMVRGAVEALRTWLQSGGGDDA